MFKQGLPPPKAGNRVMAGLSESEGLFSGGVTGVSQLGLGQKRRSRTRLGWLGWKVDGVWGGF